MRKHKQVISIPNFNDKKNFSFNIDAPKIMIDGDFRAKSFQDVFIQNTNQKNLKIKEYFKKRTSEKMLSKII